MTKQRHYFADKSPSSQSYGFSSSQVWMWKLDYKRSWALKNRFFWTMVLEKTLESPLHYKEVKPVHPKGDQSWIFIGRTDVEAYTPILWPRYAKNWLIVKDPDAGQDWRQEEKGVTEDKMVGCHHWLYGHEFEQAPGVGNGQGSLMCCHPWDCKESDTTEPLNWTELCPILHIKEMRLKMLICPDSHSWWVKELWCKIAPGNSRRQLKDHDLQEDFCKPKMF